MVVPTKTKPQIPAGPVKLTVGVEESRAQRHQRQLSRFRDRGGIFVPTTRNTLADILMKRRAASPKRSSSRAASPQKSLRRSASPTKRDARSEDVADSKRAASPAKASRKNRVPDLSNASSSEQMQKKRKLEAETQETQPTFIGSEDTKTQPKRRATRTRKVQESLDCEQEKTVRPENAPKSKPKRGAQSRKPAKSKTDAKALKPLKGLPVRVLQRLKNSVPHTMDNEPDPIDFLS